MTGMPPATTGLPVALGKTSPASPMAPLSSRHRARSLAGGASSRTVRCCRGLGVGELAERGSARSIRSVLSRMSSQRRASASPGRSPA